MGFDYFGARYLASAQGRWTSPDPKLMPDAVDDPQSWNKYGYVRNNPLRLIDPDGQDWKDAVSGWMNAISSNFAGGTGRSTGNSDFRFGQKVGDAVSMVIGAAEMAVGGGGAGGGIAACGSGVGCVVGAPVIVADAAVGAHGAMMSGAALANFVKASDDAPKSSGGQSKQSSGGSSSSSQSGPELVTNPKHHPNSKSPQPGNVQDLFKGSTGDKSGVRWAKDADGTIHRFSAPSNGQTHWNGSTSGNKPIRLEDIPSEIRRQLK